LNLQVPVAMRVIEKGKGKEKERRESAEAEVERERMTLREDCVEGKD
jgi:hypothetical protein